MQSEKAPTARGSNAEAPRQERNAKSALGPTRPHPKDDKGASATESNRATTLRRLFAPAWELKRLCEPSASNPEAPLRNIATPQYALNVHLDVLRGIHQHVKAEGGAALLAAFITLGGQAPRRAATLLDELFSLQKPPALPQDSAGAADASTTDRDAQRHSTTMAVCILRIVALLLATVHRQSKLVDVLKKQGLLSKALTAYRDAVPSDSDGPPVPDWLLNELFDDSLQEGKAGKLLGRFRSMALQDKCPNAALACSLVPIVLFLSHNETRIGIILKLHGTPERVVRLFQVADVPPIASPLLKGSIELLLLAARNEANAKVISSSPGIQSFIVDSFAAASGTAGSNTHQKDAGNGDEPTARRPSVASASEQRVLLIQLCTAVAKFPAAWQELTEKLPVDALLSTAEQLYARIAPASSRRSSASGKSAGSLGTIAKSSSRTSLSGTSDAASTLAKPADTQTPTRAFLVALLKLLQRIVSVPSGKTRLFQVSGPSRICAMLSRETAGNVAETTAAPKVLPKNATPKPTAAKPKGKKPKPLCSILARLACDCQPERSLPLESELLDIITRKAACYSEDTWIAQPNPALCEKSIATLESLYAGTPVPSIVNLDTTSRSSPIIKRIKHETESLMQQSMRGLLEDPPSETPGQPLAPISEMAAARVVCQSVRRTLQLEKTPAVRPRIVFWNTHGLESAPQIAHGESPPVAGALEFDASFESSNLQAALQLSDTEYDLLLASDTNAPPFMYSQWFCFAVRGMQPNVPYRFNIVNMNKPSSQYRFGMQPVCYCASWGKWIRAGSAIHYFANAYRRPPPFASTRTNKSPSSTTYSTLTFTMTVAQQPTEWHLVAYHYPYTTSALDQSVARMMSTLSDQYICYRQPLCHTPLGNSVELITVTDSSTPETIPERLSLFLSARVHPGESNASHMMHGLLQTLLSGDSLVARQVLKRYVIHLVPMLNPDGVMVGNTRCSLSGYDLNRQWSDPSPTRFPEVYYTRKVLSWLVTQQVSAPVLYCDLHGHSQKKSIFAYGCPSPVASTSSDTCPCPDGLEDGLVTFFLPNKGAGPQAAADCGAEAAALTLQRSSSAGSLNIGVSPNAVLPTALAEATRLFSLRRSTYTIHSSKESTARVVLYRAPFNIPFSYTIESTFCAPERGHLRGFQTTAAQLYHFGACLAKSLLDERVMSAFMTCRSQPFSGNGMASSTRVEEPLRTLESDSDADTSCSDDA